MDKTKLTERLNDAGWSWMTTSEKYIHVDRHDTERCYWIAPFAWPDDNAVDERQAKSFTSLKAIEAFLKQQKREARG